MYSPFAQALSFIPRFLLLGVWIACVVFALISRKKHPLKSLLVLIAAMLQIINMVLTTGTTFLISRIDTSGVDIGFAFMVLDLIQTTISFIAWVLILAALFFVPQGSGMGANTSLFGENS